MDGSEAASWVEGLMGLGGAVIATFAALDARRSADRAQHTNDAMLALQKRDEERREADSVVQREVDAVLAAAKAGWKRQWDDCWRLATSVDRAPLDQQKNFAMRRLSDGLIVKRDEPGRQDVEVRLANHVSVTRAHALPEGYRVVLKFDPEDPGRVL